MNKLGMIFLLVGVSSCGFYNSFDCYEDKVITKTIATRDFHKLDIDFSSTVFLKEGSQLEVKIEAKEDLIADLELLSKVENDTWKARIKNQCLGREKSETKLFLTIPNLSEIIADGHVNISTDKSLSTTTENFFCKVDGNADLVLDLLNSSVIELTADGSADVELNGKGKSLDIKIDGNADVRAHNFEIDECNLVVDGSAYVEVKVNRLLKVNNDGVGSVCYKGNPTIESKNNGVGRVKNCN